jgi:hypothetical protein
VLRIYGPKREGDGSCRTLERMERGEVFTGFWLGGPMGRPSRRWENNLREIGIDGANLIRLSQDRVRWRAFVNTVMNLRVP